MAVWEEAHDLKEIARQIVRRRDEIAHVEVDNVLWLRELETKPKTAMARCYRLANHPIGFFTDKHFAIVLYWQHCDVLSPNQLKILLFHEMMHIPATGDQLVMHDVQDFRAVLGIDLDWARPGREVPDILG